MKMAVKLKFEARALAALDLVAKKASVEAACNALACNEINAKALISYLGTHYPTLVANRVGEGLVAS